MQNAGGILDLIILGLVFWFIFSRFTSNKLPKSGKRPTSLNTASVLPFKEKPKSSKKEPTDGMAELKKLDRTFNENSFLNGAKEAFFMFYDGANNQDEDLLENLTSPKLFDEVMDKIEEKMDKGVIPKTDVKEIVSADIIDTRIQGKAAIVSVKYNAKIAEYEENIKTNKVTKNAAKKAKTIQTVWTWARPVDSDDPNWELEEINALS
jgi:predicted lipid-binding transport protein (Tim44 family)